ncbi:MAG: ABC transporter permease [Gorillibacterium sp.]|nr:ABC transporter permease [Gorillibacterium sp.]
MKGFWSVLKFTFLSRFRSKSFLVITILFALLISIGINLPSIIESFSNDKATKIGMFMDEEIYPQLKEHFAEQKPISIDIVEYKDQGSIKANEAYARDRVANKEVKGFLLEDKLQVKDSKSQGAEFPSFVYLSRESFMQQGDKTTLQSALQALKFNATVKDLGLTKDQLERLNAPVVVDSIQVEDGGGTTGSGGEPPDTGKTESEQILSYIMVYVLMTLLFMAITMYGNMTAAEITGEKSSRVMEILITSVSPLKQMFGKVFGMFLLGTLQMLIFISMAVINLNLPNNKSFFDSVDIHFADIPGMLYVYFVIFYLLGFFLYVMLFAAIGSVVSRTEDLGQAILPVTFLALGAFYIGIYGINAPTSAFTRVCSFIPFFTPNVMFLRIGMSGVPAWEIWLSIGIMLISILFSGWLSAKIYRAGVLMYGKRPSLKELSKALRTYKG